MILHVQNFEIKDLVLRLVKLYLLIATSSKKVYNYECNGVSVAIQ